MAKTNFRNLSTKEAKEAAFADISKECCTNYINQQSRILNASETFAGVFISLSTLQL